MKKFTILCVAAALLFPAHAGAQAFNHLSAGIGLGTDGLNIQLAAPLGSAKGFILMPLFSGAA